MQSEKVMLSNELINEYQLEAHITQLRDIKSPLIFRYFKEREKGAFYFVIWLHGKAHWKKLGLFPNISTTTAKKAMAIAEKQLRLSALHGNVSSVPFSSLKFVGDVLYWYQERVQQDQELTLGTKNRIISAINAHLLPCIGQLTIKEINRSTLDEYLMWPLQKKLKNSSIRQIFQVLKQAFKRAEGTGVIINNPISYCKFTQFISGKVVIKPARLTAIDLPKIFADIEKAPPSMQTLVLMMLLFGSRIGETRLTKWCDLDKRANFWRIRAENTKTKQAHRLPLTSVAWQVLNRHRQSVEGPAKRSPYLFPKRTNIKYPIDAQYASQRVSMLGNKDWSAHDLRKFARTSWQELGVDYVIGEFLINHQLRSLDQAYIQTFSDAKCMEALTTWHHYLFEHGLGAFLSQRQSEDC